jgi:hypothetical protein
MIDCDCLCVTDKDDEGDEEYYEIFSVMMVMMIGCDLLSANNLEPTIVASLTSSSYK